VFLICINFYNQKLLKHKGQIGMKM